MKTSWTPLLLLLLLAACKSKPDTGEEDEPESVITPVTVTTVESQPMEEYVELNAISSFQQKWTVRANTSGYIRYAGVVLNKQVQAGQTLYTVQTKEARTLGNTVNILDSSFHFSGVTAVPASGSGFISQIEHQAGDYVQEGDPLAVITDTRSFVFLLDLPYELRPFIVGKKSLELELPDGEKLTGSIGGNMPVMDAVSQTQSIILRVNPGHPLPENLIAKVKVVKHLKTGALTIPKQALLKNETQTETWVMKMAGDSLALKVPVKTGIESSDRVEILSPAFAADDRILISGNFGLEDSARVKIVKE